MTEWLLEGGIGETRVVRIVEGAIADALIFIDGIERAGSRLAARLKSLTPRALAEANGQEYLLPKGAREVHEGAKIVIEVTREVIPGTEPWKRPLARITDEELGAAPMIEAQSLTFPGAGDILGAAGWWDLLDEARTGNVQFPGGELRIVPTPAMTLIDVDGYLPPDELAIIGAEAAAKAIRRLDIGGSIGIDLPTSQSKAARNAAAAAIDEVLPKPFERTAVNGFGFLQVVRPRARASLIELAQDRLAFEARSLLRQAAFGTAGRRQLVGHPALVAFLKERPNWLDALSKQTGGAVNLQASPSVTISGGYAETR